MRLYAKVLTYVTLGIIGLIIAGLFIKSFIDYENPEITFGEFVQEILATDPRGARIFLVLYLFCIGLMTFMLSNTDEDSESYYP